MERRENHKLFKIGEAVRKQDLGLSLCLFCIFVVSYGVFFCKINFSQEIYNSDFAYYAIAGKDIIEGNVILKGWYGATNTFYLNDLIYGIFGKIFGYSIDLIYQVSSTLWAATVTLISYFVFRLKENCGIREKYLCVLLAISLLYGGCYLKQDGHLFAGAHLDVCLLGLLYIWVFAKNDRVFQYRENLVRSIAASFGLFLAVLSDDLTVYFIVLPCVMAMGVKLVFGCAKSEERKNLIFKLAVTIFIPVLAKVFLHQLGKWGGITVNFQATSQSFIPSGDLFNKISFFIEELSYLFGFDFFCKKIASLDHIWHFFNLAFVAAAFVGLALSFKKVVKDRLFNQILLWIIIIESCIILLTAYLDDSVPGSSRIMYYLWLSLILLVSQTDIPGILQKNWRPENDDEGARSRTYVYYALGAFALISLILNIHFTRAPQKLSENNRFQKTVSVLREKGLTHGYGTFWLANVTTLTSGCDIYVNPACNGQDFSKFEWLSVDTSDWDSANFVLVDDSGWDNVTRSTVVDAIGEPDEEIIVDNINVMIWNKNIMPYIDGSGAGEDLDYWWDFSEGETSKTIEVTSAHFKSFFQPTEDGRFVSDKAGQLLYGPYSYMKSGVYDITFVYGCSFDEENGTVIGHVDACSISGKLKSGQADALFGQDTVTLEGVVVQDGCTDAEIRMYVDRAGVTIKQIIIERK